MSDAPKPDDGLTVRAMRDATGDLAIYVHWPFCLSKCPYCDFNSHVRDDVDQARWRSALLGDLDRWSSLASGRKITSLFFGGGTPSLMDPASVTAVIDRAAAHWTFAADAEITLEANPTSVEAGRLVDYRAAGVNRISLGIQALDDRALILLGRNHNADEATKAIELASRLFDRFSFDLIYARPGQTVAAWREELAQAVRLANDHISVYQLTMEAGTAFHARWRRGELTALDETTAAAQFEETQNALEVAGLPAYEISNHARAGEECRHNLTYWRCGDYAGIGPGAHGRLTIAGDKRAFRQIRGPEAWLHAVERHGHGMMEPDSLCRTERLEEALMMGLRLTEHLPVSHIEREAGTCFEQALSPERLKELVDGGFLEFDSHGLRATQTGRQRLNAVLARLLC